MSEVEKLDVERMFRHACAFADCAIFCEREPNNVVEVRTHSHTAAGIVNSVFACEVFIKTLLTIAGIDFKKEHRLKVLWHKLKKVDTQTTDLLEDSIQKYFNTQNEKLFQELLNQASDAFICWRYIYEVDEARINILFLIRLRNLLREECCKKLYGQSWMDYVDSIQCKGK